MNLVEIDESSSVPASEQIRSQITGMIRSGQLGPGTRLPSIRQLASDLGLAAGTVARVYATLEAGGLVESHRALGTQVAESQMTASRTTLAALGLVQAARQEDLGLDDTVAALRAAWSASHKDPGG